VWQALTRHLMYHLDQERLLVPRSGHRRNRPARSQLQRAQGRTPKLGRGRETAADRVNLLRTAQLARRAFQAVLRRRRRTTAPTQANAYGRAGRRGQQRLPLRASALGAPPFCAGATQSTKSSSVKKPTRISQVTVAAPNSNAELTVPRRAPPESRVREHQHHRLVHLSGGAPRQPRCRH
jgi:hypothetical protein